MDLLEKVKAYALERHHYVNHWYGDKRYALHLGMTVLAAEQFIHLVAEEDQENVYCGCWVHDIIEDARETYNDVLKKSNFAVANIAYALTNEKGKTREERANEKYYAGIRATKYATFVKLCDRIANITYSGTKRTSMFAKYKAENADFTSKLYCKELDGMFKHIEWLLENAGKLPV